MGLLPLPGQNEAESYFPIKTLERFFFIYINNIILNFILKANEIIVANMTLKNKNKVGRINLSDFKIITVAAIKTMWYWQRGRQIDKCNRSENP